MAIDIYKKGSYFTKFAQALAKAPEKLEPTERLKELPGNKETVVRMAMDRRYKKGLKKADEETTYSKTAALAAALVALRQTKRDMR